jgi:YggT family protein
MSGFLTDAASLIVQVAFGLYVLAVLLRFLMQVTRADFYNPIAQFVVTLTNPPLKPLRRLIPGLFGIDLASLLLLFGLQYLEITTLLWIRGVTVDPLSLLLPTVIELVRLTIYVFLFAILIRVVLSCVSPYGLHHNPAGSLLISLSEPLLRPARRWIPPIGGLDLSPIAVLVLLQLLLLALSHLLR